MRYEKLSNVPHSTDEDLAFLYCDDGNAVREHFVCYRVSGSGEPRQYVVVHMASEDTDFYDYRAAAPEERGLEIQTVYRVQGSEQANVLGGVDYDSANLPERVFKGDGKWALPRPQR
jgi:hypothetical protein